MNVKKFLMTFQGTPRNVKQEQQVMGLSSFPVLPRPPAGPSAVEALGLLVKGHVLLEPDGPRELCHRRRDAQYFWDWK
jgi:hypothetical protein